MEVDPPFPRTAPRGRTYVYLLPCRDADVAKIGYSRDPLARLRTLHRRFFELFDLERAVLLETAKLADARAIETQLHRRFAADRVPAPLYVREAAVGRFEWFCGVCGAASDALRTFAAAGSGDLHAPLRGWLYQQLAGTTDWLYAASARLLEVERGLRLQAASSIAVASRAGMTLAQVLDTYEALGFAVEAIVPTEVARWHDERHALRFGT